MSKATRAARRAAKNEAKVTLAPVIADGEAAEANASQAVVESVTTEIVSDPKTKKKVVRYAKRTWSPTDIITLNRKDNHKKGKSFHRYALYRDGMTVQEYTEAVVKAGLGNKTLASNDLRWDTAPTRNFISIAPAAK